MPEPKIVTYMAVYRGNMYDILCWEGTTLGQVWNDRKEFYLPGDIVTITDNLGHSKTFMKGMC